MRGVVLVVVGVGVFAATSPANWSSMDSAKALRFSLRAICDYVSGVIIVGSPAETGSAVISSVNDIQVGR